MEQARVESDNECSDFLPAVQQVLAENGRAAFRENPGNSLHWDDPVEAVLLGTEEWFDFEYYACVFLSARKKFQRIRRNLEPFRQLPFHQCGHIHSSNEWTPKTTTEGIQYPSRQEAEYSASLCHTIVVVASHWAADRGFAVRRIQRLPLVQVSGDWRKMLEFPAPRSARTR